MVLHNSKKININEHKVLLEVHMAFFTKIQLTKSAENYRYQYPRLVHQDTSE